MKDFIPITVAFGDGVGPELMEAVLHILREARVPISVETVEISQRMYHTDHPGGMSTKALSTIRRTRALLLAPVLPPVEAAYVPAYDFLCEQLELHSCERAQLRMDTHMRCGIHDPWYTGIATWGNRHALFMPAHEAAPHLAGKDEAHPSAMLQAALLMLDYLGLDATAAAIRTAWQESIIEGYHTAQMRSHRLKSHPDCMVGTQAFSQAIAERIALSEPMEKACLH